MKTIICVALLCVVALVGVSACKVDNQIEKDTYTEADFTVACLFGHKYAIRKASATSYMAPIFDKDTHLPIACESY